MDLHVPKCEYIDKRLTWRFYTVRQDTRSKKMRIHTCCKAVNYVGKEHITTHEHKIQLQVHFCETGPMFEKKGIEFDNFIATEYI